MNNDKNLVIVGIIIIIITSMGSFHLFSTSSKTEDGKNLSFIDTIKNIFGILPMALTTSVNTIGTLASNTIKNLENELEEIVKEVPEVITEVATETSSFIEKEEEIVTNMLKSKEVFNIDKNLFTYEEAPLVCKALGAELATYDQVKKAHKKGANWCNYGWTDNQMALFPIQSTIYNNMTDDEQKGCGKPGVNGGYFDDKSIKLGVNCYGKKIDPDPAKIVYIEEEHNNQYSSEITNDSPQKTEIMNKYEELKNAGKLVIRPFNTNKWSKYSSKKSTYIINPDTETDTNSGESWVETAARVGTIYQTPGFTDAIQQLIDDDILPLETAVSCMSCYKGCNNTDNTECNNQCMENDACSKLRLASKLSEWTKLADIKYTWNSEAHDGISFDQAHYLGDTEQFEKWYENWKTAKIDNNLKQWLEQEMKK